MKKHVLARALALVMSLSLLSTSAFAAVAFDPDFHVGEDGSLLSYKDSETLKQSYDYYLDKDIDLDKTLVIKGGANASIDLNGFTLSGNGESSVIKVTGDGTSLTLDDQSEEGTGTITGGGGKAGGGVYVEDQTSVTMNGGAITGNKVAEQGGGVYIKDGGSFTLNDGAEISENKAGMTGGGVFVNGYKDWDKAEFTMNGGTISGNTAGNGNTGAGGGIGAYGTYDGDRGNASVVINGGEITDNHVNYTGSNGAGIAVENGSLTMNGGTVSGNTAANLGGGIYSHDSKTEISNVTVSGNEAADRGGGIFINGNDVKLTNNTISGNQANQNGGGVYVMGIGTTTMNGNSITGNKANQGGGIYATGNKANVTMTGGSISNNTADMVGGGVRLANGVTFTMNSGSITGNACFGENYGGGGVYSYKDTKFIMNGGEITGNTAANGYGGGVFNHTATFTMNGGKLYGNSADVSGDDIYSDTRKGGSIVLISAKDMGVMEGGKNVSQWMGDASDGRWEGGNYLIPSLDGNGVLCLKAAHDQYFNVTYHDGEKVLQTSNLEKGSEFPTCQEPTREGYTFAGWNLELPETVNGNIMLTAKWDPIPVEPTEPTDPEEPSEPTEPEEPVDPEEPTEPEEPGVVIPDPDVPMGGAPDADTVDIEDEEVPLAGMMSTAQLLEELRVREEIADVELPEDFKFMDHDYAQAIFWALSEELVADTEEEPLDPDEIVTVGLMRKVLNAFAVNCKGYEDFATAIEGEDDEIVIDLGERLNLFYEELEQYAAE